MPGRLRDRKVTEGSAGQGRITMQPDGAAAGRSVRARSSPRRILAPSSLLWCGRMGASRRTYTVPSFMKSSCRSWMTLSRTHGNTSLIVS